MNRTARNITISAMLTGFALALFSVELLLPSLPFCPSAKIGLANIVTLFMICHSEYFKKRQCFLVIIARCLLAALITGRLTAVFFSLSGGICALIFMLAARRVVGSDVIVISIVGAIFHNLTQMAVALLFYGIFSVVYYLPALLLTGIASGIITGLCVMMISKNNFLKKILDN